MPPIEEVPPFLRGQNFVIVEAVVLGDEAYGTELLRPLRELGPAIDTFAMTAPVGISELHMDPPVPMPYAGGGHVLLSELTPSVIEGFVAATGPGSGSPLVSAEIRHNGGALSRAAKGSGAYASVPGEYMSFGVGMVFDAAGREAVVAQLAMIEEVLEPVDTGRKYLNFTEEPTDPAQVLQRGGDARLRTVKARVDPLRGDPGEPPDPSGARRHLLTDHTVGAPWPAQARVKPAPAMAVSTRPGCGSARAVRPPACS